MQARRALSEMFRRAGLDSPGSMRGFSPVTHSVSITPG